MKCCDTAQTLKLWNYIETVETYYNCSCFLFTRNALLEHLYPIWLTLCCDVLGFGVLFLFFSFGFFIVVVCLFFEEPNIVMNLCKSAEEIFLNKLKMDFKNW